MRTSDIRGAQPKKLNAALRYIKDQFKQGEVVYQNKNHLGNGDIVSLRTKNPIENIKIRPKSKRVFKGKRNTSDH